MSVDEELARAGQAGEPGADSSGSTPGNPPRYRSAGSRRVETAVNADACKRRGIDIVRRITGGRAVLHHHELTYSIVARIDNPLFPSECPRYLQSNSHGLLAGLKNLGIPAEMVTRGGRHAGRW